MLPFRSLNLNVEVNMIEITLSFGTIEEAGPVLALLQGHNETTRLQSMKRVTPIAPAEAEAKNAQKPATTSAPPPATPSSSTPAESPETSQPAAAPATGTSTTYPDLQRAIIKLVAKSPDAMRAICGEFGLKTFAGSPENVWPKALARVNEEIAKQGA